MLMHCDIDLSKLFDILEENSELPEHKLFRSILERAVFDLTPEAPHEDRRNSISWFHKTYDEGKEPVTSYQFIKTELNLGVRLLQIIDCAVKEAIEYEDYYLSCYQREKPPSIQEWLIMRDNSRTIGRRPRATRIRYRRSSYVPQDK